MEDRDMDMEDSQSSQLFRSELAQAAQLWEYFMENIEVDWVAEREESVNVWNTADLVIIKLYGLDSSLGF